MALTGKLFSSGGSRAGRKKNTEQRSSSGIHRFFNFVSHRFLCHSLRVKQSTSLFCSTKSSLLLLIHTYLKLGKISCHYYLSLFPSLFHPPHHSLGAIFSIKFIHLLIIAVNHSSCNDFYEFLFVHRVGFRRCRAYSSLLSIIISPTVGWLCSLSPPCCSIIFFAWWVVWPKTEY